jgi:MFS transporter, DHA1 family, multidrug resistance protein
MVQYRVFPEGAFMNRPIVIVSFTLFIVMVGFGIIIPIMPFYITSMGASPFDLGLLMSSFSLVQFIFAPFWGNLSDRIGRKPLIAIGLVGYIISYLIMASASAVWMLFAGRILGGMLSSATLPAAQAYVADTTSIKERGAGMGMLGAAMGLGMVFGPGIGGLMSTFGLAAPFLFAAVLAALNLVFVFAFLPEPKRAPVSATERRRPSQVALMRRALGGPLAFFFVMAFLVSFAMANLESTLSLYSQARLGFTATDMGIAFTFMGLAGAIMQGLLVGKAIDRYGEERLIQFGLIATATGFLLILAAFDRISMIVFMTAQSVGSAFLRPAISSLLSKRTTDGQGATLGMQASFDSLGRIVGPSWGGFIFESHHTYPYLTGAGVFLVAWVASLIRLGRTPGKPVDALTE